MVGIFFSLLMVTALLSICGEIVMRVRLTRRASRDKIAWWRRGGDEVAATYEEVFPDSRLPFLRRFVSRGAAGSPVSWQAGRRIPAAKAESDYRPSAFWPRSAIHVEAAFAINRFSSSVMVHST